MQSTLGFSPLVTRTSNWLDEDGKEQFVLYVKTSVENQIKQPVTIDASTRLEIINRLIDTVIKQGDDETVIKEVHTFVTHMLVNRFRMRERLTSISNNPIRLQPRGSDDREKGDMPMMTMRNSGKVYADFLKEQHKYRS